MFITKKNLKDWKLWYKLSISLLIIGFLLQGFIRGMINIGDSVYKIDGEEFKKWAIYIKDINNNKPGEFVGYDYQGYIINYFSFFTIQSNILVAIWFLVSFFNHNREGQVKFLSRTITLCVVTYITITGLIFNGMLLPQVLLTENDLVLTPIWWIDQMVLHTVVPIATIAYYLFLMKQELNFSFKEFIKKDFLVMCIYPIIYLIFSLIRGELIYRSVGSNALLASKKGAYPYFFLEIHNNQVSGLSGIVWMFIAIIAIISIIIGLGSLYLFIASKINNYKGEITNEESEK
ncbi:Pr6Pr family membrane protein [Spiroplasma cantharicola]|uniref:Uncharacterized protein n=1 Tax=Spiroplasma cantharicola TaxID=362837 RepID=A0A0M3SJB4_9MOLU|nr:Pr6Pr family membrane protein [Spiroplasma cantharicola]ALD66458.1 hypothetical protein SCANT_v1c05520 [Spiroplasma cantharicola]